MPKIPKTTAGPDVGGNYGPYRQSERRDLYRKYVDQLVEAGTVYPCFCTDEELAAMKADAEKKSLPPIYRQASCCPCLVCNAICHTLTADAAS